MQSSLARTIALVLIVVVHAGCTEPEAFEDDVLVTADTDTATDTDKDDVTTKAGNSVAVYVEPVYGGPDYTTSDLQAALDFVSQPSLAQTAVWIQIQPGLYRNDGSCLTVGQDDWRTSCSPIDSRTGFLLAGRRAPTHISGTTGNPQDVVIWAKVPNDVLADANQAFHGLTLDDNTQLVDISDLSIAADGGWVGNGVGDASLNVVNSRVDLENVIVLANKSNSNCLWGNTSGDQEGVVAYGPATDLRIYDSAVGGNLHTGIMLVNGAKVLVESSLVRGNGWVSQFQNGNKGHGITEFHNSYAAACLDSDNEVDIHDSIVTSNSGAGVYLRGEFVNSTHSITYNDITGNNNWGILIDGGSWSGAPSITRFISAHVYIMYNRMLDNSPGDIHIDNSTIVGTNWAHVSGNSPTTAGGNGPLDSALWNKLLAVKNLLATVPRVCAPSGPICP